MKDEKIVLVEILPLISHTYSFILMKYVFKKIIFLRTRFIQRWKELSSDMLISPSLEISMQELMAPF